MKKSERLEDGPKCPRCTTTNKPTRSFCRVCGLHLKRSAPKRGEAVKSVERAARWRRSPIAQASAKRLSQQERRTEVIAEVHARDKVCQGGALVALAQIPHGGPLDVHELIARSQWAAGFLEPANCILLCRKHHDFVTTHAYSAHALGLRLWSWERDRVSPATAAGSALGSRTE